MKGACVSHATYELNSVQSFIYDRKNHAGQARLTSDRQFAPQFAEQL